MHSCVFVCVERERDQGKAGQSETVCQDPPMGM